MIIHQHLIKYLLIAFSFLANATNGECRRMDSCFFTSACSAQFFALKNYPNSSARVLQLLSSGNPDAVLSAIVSIHLFSLDGITLRANSHISNEGIEIVQPFITNLDTSTAVAMVRGLLGIQASGLHGTPDAIGESVCRNSALTMSFDGPSHLNTAATFAASISHVGKFKKTLRSAVASGVNLSPSSLPIFRQPCNDEFSESQANYVRINHTHEGIVANENTIASKLT